MPEFDVEQYLQQLETSTSCHTCPKVPSPKLGKKERYIFISYSHKDYKQVYADLAQLYDTDIPFWYDEGLPAGKSWDDVVQERITDSNCAGVIFYLSENLFLSRSIQTEIGIACPNNDKTSSQMRNYFCVNLTDRTPFDISRETILQMSFAESQDKMEAQLAWLSTLTHAFSDRITYLSYDKENHIDELIEQIALVFGIDPDFNAFSFNGASFHSGSGIIEFSNGCVYEGSFSNNQLCGQGTMQYANGMTYKGEWKFGKRHGQGSFTWSDGAAYVGDWAEGKRHGYGTFCWPNNSVYTGDWIDGQRHGFGKMTFPDKKYYEGEWVAGKRHGKGTMTWPDGTIYDGQWDNGKRHGKGIMTWPDGTSYNGLWVNGKRHGKGIVSSPDGITQTLLFKHDKCFGPVD